MKDYRLGQLFGLRKQSIEIQMPAFAHQGRAGTSLTAKIIGWTSVALGVAALGVFVGRELRVRYKFRHRTPYDYYAHSADAIPAADYGMGI